MPMTAFIGVRISWLIVARNELLASFAVSAAARASCASSKSIAFCSADADVGGDGFEQALVVVVVDALALGALHADHTLALAAHPDGHAEVRARRLANEAAAQFLPPFAHVRVEDQRLAGFDDPARQSLAELQRKDRFAVLIGKVDHAGAPVEQRHVGDVGVEHAADLVADERDQRIDVELVGELLRHGVHRRELGRALLGLGEQARVLDGHGRLQRESDEELELGR